MGCDGGSIPTRVEMVKVKKQPAKTDNAEHARFSWHSCALSKEPLEDPIVCCRLGHLFNKEAVLTHLLHKTMPAEFSYIRSLKDVMPVRFTRNPEWQEKGDKPVLTYITSGNGAAPFVCPITGLEVNGHHPFSMLVTCGCVFSERAIREVLLAPTTTSTPSASSTPPPISTRTCPQCHIPYTQNDIRPLNPKPEVLEQLRARYAEQDEKEKELAQAKRREKRKRKASEKDGTGGEKEAEKEEEEEGTTSTAENKEKKKEKKNKKNKKKLKITPTTTTTTTTTTTSTPSVTAYSNQSEAYKSIFISSLKERKPVSFTHYA